MHSLCKVSDIAPVECELLRMNGALLARCCSRRHHRHVYCTYLSVSGTEIVLCLVSVINCVYMRTISVLVELRLCCALSLSSTVCIWGLEWKRCSGVDVRCASVSHSCQTADVHYFDYITDTAETVFLWCMQSLCDRCASVDRVMQIIVMSTDGDWRLRQAAAFSSVSQCVFLITQRPVFTGPHEWHQDLPQDDESWCTTTTSTVTHHDCSVFSRYSNV